MGFLGIGLPELVVVALVIMLVMSPEDVQKTARFLGRWIRQARTSGWWYGLLGVNREIRRQFYRLAQEAGLDERPWPGEVWPPDGAYWPGGSGGPVWKAPPAEEVGPAAENSPQPPEAPHA